MTFQPDKVSQFLALFEERKEQIRHFPGCSYLQLLRERPDGNIFFTYSIWEDDNALEAYRHSPLFKDTWKHTKALFSARAEAWSLDTIHQID